MTNLLLAVLITTNLVSHPCTGGTPGGKCEWCRQGQVDQFGFPTCDVCIPEHINRIGYDMDWVVTTQYLPVVERPMGPAPKEKRRAKYFKDFFKSNLLLIFLLL